MKCIVDMIVLADEVNTILSELDCFDVKDMDLCGKWIRQSEQGVQSYYDRQWWYGAIYLYSIGEQVISETLYEIQ